MRTVALYAVLAACQAAAAPFQQDLWLGRGEPWRARFPVTITNPSDTPLEGEPVALAVGALPGQAPLAGERVEAVRVTDPSGRQLLFAVRTPEQEALLATGAVPAAATLVLPAVCPPRTSVTYTVYYDNPRAWGLADFFEKRVPGDPNGGFERGAGGVPAVWQPKLTDAAHRVSWSTLRPASGARCLTAEADPGAPPTWFGYASDGLKVVPGAACTVRVRVRGQGVQGSAGWYVHVGDEQNPQRVNQVARAGEGTFDWSELTLRFTVPEGATRLQTGSVLYGTGTAWYDDFRFETDRPAPLVTARGGATEHLVLTERGQEAPWPQEPECRPHGLGRLTAPFRPHRRAGASAWSYRLPVRVSNLHDEPTGEALATLDLHAALRGLDTPRLSLTLEGRPVEICRLADRLLFTCQLPPRTVLTYYLYVGESAAPRTAVTNPAASALGSDIPSDQILAEHGRESDAAAFARLLRSPVNRVRNPDFAEGPETAPEAWSRSAAEPGVTFSLAAPGGFGARHARLTVAPGTRESWRGWYQSVPVRPGHSYLFGAWLASEGLTGSANLHAHLRDAQGAVVSGGFLSAGPAVSGTMGWTPVFSTVSVPPDAAQLALHLTMNDTGTLKHDGAFAAVCVQAAAGEPQAPDLAPDTLAVWQADPLVKIFRETRPPARAAPLSVSMARREEEPLQLAVRAGRDHPEVRVEVDAPTLDGRKGGRALAPPEVGWVGYVPIDHPTAYYNLKTPQWELKYPTRDGSSDGWSGWWPDPIRPTDTGALAANRTQALWLTFATGADTRPGRYRGTVRLVSGGRTLEAIPYTVTVWAFTLPERPSCAAIYDLRLNAQWLAEGDTAEATRDRLMRFMARKKVCPDEVGVNLQFTRDAQGRVTCDFTAYDAAARRYFDELKFPVSYTPHAFYLFGWEHPPKDVLGERPFEGDYPYPNADRTKLRPAYVAAYQDCLRLYWEHVKAQGWADRIVLYLSDEPFLTKKPIIDQMKACCEMIHAVDPSIRIYSSTWRHTPEWNGHLDIWGAGHYGCFPVEEMRARRAAGERIWFTTDGQMCTDTPFCAVERLLPHYCFTYDADAYEFWGVSWLTYDPWQYGWHRFIHQSSTPGESYSVRYPNGDGYLLYPGRPAGFEGPVTTVRLEAARDGVEDYEYLRLLRERPDDATARALLADFAALVAIPNAGGRYSTRILPDPARLTALRLRAGAHLDRLAR